MAGLYGPPAETASKLPVASSARGVLMLPARMALPLRSVNEGVIAVDDGRAGEQRWRGEERNPCTLRWWRNCRC